MSKYTTQLRYIVESGYNLGLSDYPIFDGNYREILNQKIIQHYYFREIGLETSQLFKVFLNRKMNEIMPYYNQLYESAKLVVDPLNTISVEEVFNKQNEQKGDDVFKTSTNRERTVNDTTITTANSKNLSNDTPMGTLGDPWSENYATVAGQDEGESNVTVTNTEKEEESKNDNRTTGNTGKENSTKSIKGKNDSTSYSELLIKYRETFLNIDMLVIGELEPLFMGIW